MTDLIERLRDPKERVYPDDLMDEAANRIEQLEEIVGEVIAGRYDDALLLTANLEDRE